jgi:hypothetical protein
VPLQIKFFDNQGPVKSRAQAWLQNKPSFLLSGTHIFCQDRIHG